MAEKKKIAITNLGDLRSDLGLKLADMAAAIRPLTRQTLGAIERGEFKDALYLRAAFLRMKVAFGDQFEVFDLVPEPKSLGKYFIQYKSMPTPQIDDLEIERLSFQIMDLNNKLRRAIKSDPTVARRQESYLVELHETLSEHLSQEPTVRGTLNSALDHQKGSRKSQVLSSRTRRRISRGDGKPAFSRA